MDELHDKTIAALKKQLELLNKDGVSFAELELAIKAIATLSALLTALS